LSVVSDHHDFTATDIAAIKKQSWKQYNCDYRKDYVRKGSLPVEQLLFTNTKCFY
jgi:hypothetical protein